MSDVVRCIAQGSMGEFNQSSEDGGMNGDTSQHHNGKIYGRIGLVAP